MVSWCVSNVFKRWFLLRWLQIRERRKMNKVPARVRILTKKQMDAIGSWQSSSWICFRISPKNTPTATTWCNGSLSVDWIYMGETCQQFAQLWPQEETEERNVKHSWRNPPKNFYEATAICPKTEGDCETNVKNCLETKEPFGRRKPFAAKNPRRQRCHFAPRPLLWLKTPKLYNAADKNAKKSWGTWTQV